MSSGASLAPGFTPGPDRACHNAHNSSGSSLTMASGKPPESDFPWPGLPNHHNLETDR
ncbi:hypothetical protein [Aeromonas enteropelogenes]|uniref:hypothetical protein n=1 Tax=Aeromonas enteropelogenes TaxID=29489 RepID=UPI003BA08014